MSEFIKPDKIHQIAIEDGQLDLSPPYDILHRWHSVGFSVLRYWAMQEGKLHNIPVDDAGADFLENEVGLFVIPRTFFFAHEHEMYLDWKSTEITEEEFGLDFSGIDFDAPE